MEDEAHAKAPQQTIVSSANTQTADDSAQVYQQPYITTHLAQDRQSAGVVGGNAPLDMSNVAAALPDYAYRQVPPAMYQQQFAHPAQSSSMQYPYPSAQYPGTMHNSYPVPFQQQMHPQGYQSQRMYAAYPVNANLGPVQQVYHAQPFFQPQQPQPSLGSFPQNPQGQVFGQGPNSMYGSPGPNQYRGSQIRMDNFGNNLTGSHTFMPHEMPGDPRRSSDVSLKVPSTLRGPPRKPKQSGHALWVGNLPPGSNIIDLKDHFSRDATDDIESVFLISKSNCAFVNYKSENSCTAAMGRFHDSRFNGVRLVCRLRRGSSPTTATLPAGLNATSPLDARVEGTPTTVTDTAHEDEMLEEGKDKIQLPTKVKERYFVIKSLTVEDLERSVQSGIWATQSHNEEALNRAYQTAENVFLIFSANKSGEYFGYARMVSAIDSEPSATVDQPSIETPIPQQSSSLSAAELPLTIPTPATATAPKGYVIDDSARGTIFWEAESIHLQADTVGFGMSPANTDSGDVSGEDTAEIQPISPTTADSPNPGTTFGKPFKITWLSTDRLPFYRTRGLRNPWNTNREVKIARDGTEIEPNVGRKLISMFASGVALGRQQLYSEIIPPMPGQGPAYRPY